MLTFVLVLLRAVNTVHSDTDGNGQVQWENLKIECESILKKYTIELSELSYSTYADNVGTVKLMKEQVSWEAGENCFSLLNGDQRGMFTQLDETTIPSHDGDLSSVVVDANINDVENDVVVTGDTMPESYSQLDELQITEARNQGGCGSCWAFAALSTLESAYIRYTGQWHGDVDFSEQQLLDCTYEDETTSNGTRDGCKGGWMSEAWQKLKTRENNKLCSENDYPYIGNDTFCEANKTNITNAFAKLQLVPYMSSSYVYRWYNDRVKTTKRNNAGRRYVVIAESTAKFVWQNFSVAVALHAEGGFFTYKSGIYNTDSTSSKVNHAVTIFGYSQEYFDIQNSWGRTGWGINGNGKVTRRRGNIINMFNYMMFPSVSCTFGVNAAGYCKGTGNDTGCMCYNDGICKNDGSCLCKNSYNGKTCQDKNDTDCGCQNGGTCLSTGKCGCPVNWTGDKCEVKKNDTDCECKNGGTCLSTGICKCSGDWTGEKCEDKNNDCGCKNGGTCIHTDWTAIANTCNYGYASCAELDHDLEKSPLYIKYAIAVDTGNRYVQFIGQNDSIHGYVAWQVSTNKVKVRDCPGWVDFMVNINQTTKERVWSIEKNSTHLTLYCDSVMVHQVNFSDHGSTCVDSYTGNVVEKISFYGLQDTATYSNIEGICHCPVNWTGEKCEDKKNENDCGCQNGGTCLTTGKCECPVNWTGEKCDIIPCPKKCRNGKQCYWEDSANMRCKCPAGTYGKGCTKKPDCSIREKRRCNKIKTKKPDEFKKKCSKTWGIKKCPISCGYCKK